MWCTVVQTIDYAIEVDVRDNDDAYDKAMEIDLEDWEERNSSVQVFSKEELRRCSW